MIVYKVPSHIRKQSVEKLAVKQEIIVWLLNNNFNTIEDVIKHQDKIPKKYIVPIKGKLIFNIDL